MFPVAATFNCIVAGKLREYRLRLEMLRIHNCSADIANIEIVLFQHFPSGFFLFLFLLHTINVTAMWTEFDSHI